MWQGHAFGKVLMQAEVLKHKFQLFPAKAWFWAVNAAKLLAGQGNLVPGSCLGRE